MDAFNPIVAIGGFVYAGIEVFKLVRQNKAQLEHYAAFGLGLIFFAATKTNVFLLAGFQGDSNFFWNASYLAGAIAVVPVAGVAHDVLGFIKEMKSRV